MLAGIELESPLMNAAGSINGPSVENSIREIDLLSDTAIGAIKYGSLTIPARQGNEATHGSPVYYHDKATGRTYNSIGLANIGIDAFISKSANILDATKGKPFIVSVSPASEKGKDYGTSVEQAISLASSCMTVLSSYDNGLIEINVSCPNVVTEDGGRKPIFGHDLEAMNELFEELVIEFGQEAPIGIKPPPYLSDEELAIVPELAHMIEGTNVISFFTPCNTIGGQIPRDKNGNPVLSVPGGMGGMSGPDTKYVGREQLHMWRELLPDMDMISALGIDSGQEIKARRDLGAVAAEGVTFLWESTDWRGKVTDVLTDYVEAEAA
jgi:dihydroorotate dehydrogenase